MSTDDKGRADEIVKTVEDLITYEDTVKSLGKPGVLRQPTVFPFLFIIDIPDATASSVNFPEMQGTSLQEFSVETDGEVTIDSNLWNLLNNSAKLALNGDFSKEVPQGFEYPIDFVPVIEYNNQSGGTRKLSFSGWLTTIARR